MSAPRLQGLRVVVTRPRVRSEELCFLLEEEGAEAVALPMLELKPPSDGRGLRAAAETLGRFSWVAFASSAGVEALAEAARTAGTVSALRRLKVAAVGAGTARAARAAGLEVILECRKGTGATLGQELAPKLQLGEEVLLPSAEQGRPELEAALLEATSARSGRGAGSPSPVVTRVAAYRSTPLGVADAVWEDLRARPPSSSPRRVPPKPFSRPVGVRYWKKPARSPLARRRPPPSWRSASRRLGSQRGHRPRTSWKRRCAPFEGRLPGRLVPPRGSTAALRF